MAADSKDVRRLAGTTFLDWTLDKELGRGDTAIVYQAKKAGLVAAVKIFFPETLTKHGKEEEVARLDLQLRLKGKKHHRNLVEIYDGGVVNEYDTLYLIMEFVDGLTLDKQVEGFDHNLLPDVTFQLCEALKFLEEYGLAHRDIKPANIIYDTNKKLVTLLDLGIVRSVDEDDGGRISGLRFVGTPRYSPPEFVWREEEESPDALRAITFYQVGATIHDLIMGEQLFRGNDQPQARLLDSIRYRRPRVDSARCQSWLLVAIRSCLVKDWRVRLSLLSWNSFIPPEDDPDPIERRILGIRLKQISIEEEKKSLELSQLGKPTRDFAKDFWLFQDELFLEIRSFLKSAPIFPSFEANQRTVNHREYSFTFVFDDSATHGFAGHQKVDISLVLVHEAEGLLEITFSSMNDHGTTSEAKWRESFTVSSGSAAISSALADMVDSLVPSVEGS